METVDFSVTLDAPTQVMYTSLIETANELPEWERPKPGAHEPAFQPFCRVAGYITPSVGFEMRLPVSNWNGRFLEIGCGGSCGGDWSDMCPIHRGYACIASDMGHKSTSTDGKWAYNNLQAEVDWSYRATHVVALAGKAIAAHYYAHEPRKSYFWGCSTGGRQGTIEAQRFPWDFDGIVAGAPPFSETDTLMHILWGERSILDTNGQPIFKADDLKLVHEAVLRQCDMDDGIRDGLVSNPPACHFDAEKLLCRGENEAACLTADKVAAVKNFYSGPVTSSGQRLSTGGFTPGSELDWRSYVPGGPYPQGRGIIADETLRYMAFLPDPGPAWQAKYFDFDHDYQRFGMMESLYGNTNSDLRKFKSTGGKLLIYHGWTDLEPSPLDSIDYYETVTKTMGGLSATQEFFRLFMVPGMNHCTGGDGAFAIDYLTYMEKWVEKGEAPDVIIGAHVPSHKDDYDGFALKFPLDQTIPVSFTRPIYPYPLRAKYKGYGDPNKAENFKSVGTKQ